MSINRVIVSGNLTRTPELRATAGGMAVLQFGIAVNDRRKNPKTGEWEDYPNFIDCTMFGKRAESVFRFLAKGSKVSIEGKLRHTRWERDGNKYQKIEIIIEEIELMTSRNNDDAPAATAPVQQSYSAPVTPVADASVYDEDIPF